MSKSNPGAQAPVSGDLCVSCGGFHEQTPNGCPFTRRPAARQAEISAETRKALKEIELRLFMIRQEGLTPEHCDKIIAASRTLGLELERCPLCELRVFSDMREHVVQCRANPARRCPNCKASFRETFDEHVARCKPFYRS